MKAQFVPSSGPANLHQHSAVHIAGFVSCEEF